MPIIALTPKYANSKKILQMNNKTIITKSGEKLDGRFVTMPPELWDLLKQEAFEQRCSISLLIQTYIKDSYARKQQT